MDNQQPVTAEMVVTKSKTNIVEEAKRIEEALLYSSKSHFAAAQFWTRFHIWTGIPVVILAAIIGVSAFAQFDKTHVVEGLLSIFIAAITSLTTFLNPNEKANTHQVAGNGYDALMNKVRIFWSVDCWGSESEAVLTKTLKDYSEQKDKLNQTCPQIPRWAYRSAKKGIAAGEGHYTVDQKEN